jgi:hypothetical protein
LVGPWEGLRWVRQGLSYLQGLATRAIRGHFKPSKFGVSVLLYYYYYNYYYYYMHICTVAPNEVPDPPGPI